MLQITVADTIIFEGVGVHLGLPSKVILHPAPANSGIVFFNPMFPNENIKLGVIIPEEAIHASVLKASKLVISTIEHLMAAVSAFGIDNLLIEVHGIEIPILDGSSLNFIDLIRRVGFRELGVPKKFLTPTKPLFFDDSQNDRYLELLPATQGDNGIDTSLYFDYFSEFKHPLIGRGSLSGIMSTNYFITEIAAARTFGFLEQLPFLRSKGLAKGTSLGNTVVIGEEEFLNEPRFKDEFVRHKFLDLIGDLALLGENLAGTVKARKTGHSLNRLVVADYINNPGNLKLI